MRDKIVASAMKWENTPYHHHARLVGIGVDCAQLLVAVAVDIGLITESQANEVPNYPPEWHLHNREEHLLHYLESNGCSKVADCIQRNPGDIAAFKFGRTCSHVGIIINDTQFIHACLRTGKVVVNTLNGDWEERLACVYRFPGIE